MREARGKHAGSAREACGKRVARSARVSLPAPARLCYNTPLADKAAAPRAYAEANNTWQSRACRPQPGPEDCAIYESRA